MKDYEIAIHKVINEIRIRLQEKTGWGRNELMTVINNALSKVLDEMQENKKWATKQITYT